MAPSPRKRLLSPRKRLPPTPFNQTWHETDAAHLDPNALPVVRIPRGWERKREVKQVAEGKEKSIWRRVHLRSGIAAAAEEDETEGEDGDDRDVQSRAVKRRQRMSPKAMEKMKGTKRAFKGTRWDRTKSVLPRKRSAQNSETLEEDQSESDDTQDITDADMADDSIAEASHSAAPSSFTFAMDAAQTADDLPDYESLDEQDDYKLGNILPEDSTLATIFRSPAKRIPALSSTTPTTIGYPTLPQIDAEEKEAVDATITRPTIDSVITEVITSVSTPEMLVSADDIDVSKNDHHDTEVEHPLLPNERISDTQSEDAQTTDTQRTDSEDEDDAEMSEVDIGMVTASAQPDELDSARIVDHESAEEEFTEASMQLDIQEDYEREGETASLSPTQETVEFNTQAIADGLTLSSIPTKIPSQEHTPKKLHSPPPPLRIEAGPDDATVTMAIDDDTAILKGFLSRAAASKAERSAIITRRESLENRRDSDIVRHALASPRRVLEEKDPNSPTKFDSEATFDVPETSVLAPEIEDSESLPLTPSEDGAAEAQSGRGSRRSSRAKKSRLPAPAAAAQPQTSNKIAIRRADGTDPVVLKKTDAQELALITKNNTRKNKQGAFMVSLRLLKLQAEAILSPSTPLDDNTSRDVVPGRRGIRWDETLAYYQEHADTIAAQQAEAESLLTPDELSLPVPSTKKTKLKTPADKNSTPKLRRVRGLGTANGTPGKGLLTTGSMLPDAVVEEQAAAAQPTPAPRGIPKPKISKKPVVTSTTPSSKLAPLEVMPVGIEPAKERKSRLATPKSVRVPKTITTAVPAVTAAATAEKENTRIGLSGVTPRKGIPAPKIVAPRSVVPPAVSAKGVESGLPRRRGRKI